LEDLLQLGAVEGPEGGGGEYQLHLLLLGAPLRGGGTIGLNLLHPSAEW